MQSLREDLKLTGAKMGCDRAQCGACTVIVNGRNVYSCTTLAVEATGAEVLTIEGLVTDDTLHPIQQAFIQHTGFQCGFCTPGQIMTTKAFLDRVPAPRKIRPVGRSAATCAAAPRIAHPRIGHDGVQNL